MRKPRTRGGGEVDWLLWRFEGTDGVPNVAPPPEHVSNRIAAIAREGFHVEYWSDLAAKAARDLGIGAVDSVLATMVHPPAGPEKAPAWVWIRRVQVAAALVAGKMDAGWNHSVRRRAVLSLLRGPVDWTTEAGIIAAMQICREPKGQEAWEEVGQEVAALRDNIPTPGACCYVYTLVCCLARAPFLPEEARREYLKVRWDMEKAE